SAAPNWPRNWMPNAPSGRPVSWWRGFRTESRRTTSRPGTPRQVLFYLPGPNIQAIPGATDRRRRSIQAVAASSELDVAPGCAPTRFDKPLGWNEIRRSAPGRDRPPLAARNLEADR